MRRIVLVAVAVASSLRAAASENRFDPLFGPPFALRDRPHLGVSSAAITVLEIRSFTCPHCLRFKRTIFPQLKEKYIDSGKVRWVMLDVPGNMKSPDEEIRQPDIPSAIAACALLNGNYWDVEAFLRANARKMGDNELSKWPEVPGLSKATIADSLVQGRALDNFRAAVSEVQQVWKAWLKDIPAFVICIRKRNGEVAILKLQGEQDLGAFERAFTALAGEAAQVGASGNGTASGTEGLPETARRQMNIK